MTEMLTRATEAARKVLGDYASPSKCEAVARAVMEAMADPTVAMTDAGHDAGGIGEGEYWEYATPEKTYRAMIDAALKEPGQ